MYFSGLGFRMKGKFLRRSLLYRYPGAASVPLQPLKVLINGVADLHAPVGVGFRSPKASGLGFRV